MRNTVQSVERALHVLTAFEVDEQELGVTEIAALLGVHKSTASRLAATLVASGFLERSPASESFRLGPELPRLAALANSRKREAGRQGSAGRRPLMGSHPGAERTSGLQRRRHR
jgi:DNA-binding IclR family transcriptional regulator